jgi:hypothetical protein
MKLIILAPFPYHQEVAHGGGYLCYEQLLHLAGQHQIHFLCFDGAQTEAVLERTRTELGALCASVTIIPMQLSRWGIIKAKLEFLSRGEPIEAVLFRSAAMHKALRDKIAETGADAVLLQFTQMAQYAPSCGDTTTLLDVQDAYSITYFRKFRAQHRSARKLLLFGRWLSWLNYERRNYPAFDAVVTLTDQDRIGLEIFSPGLGAQRSPAAITIPEASWPAPQMETASIGYICSFGHDQNMEALRYFIHTILPLIVQQRPQACLVVAGERPPAEMTALESKHVRFVGYVESADDFLRACQVFVVPLLSGGGIKIKTLRAMACGCPVISTSIGVEEVGVVDGVHALVADTPAAFAAHVVAAMTDPGLAQRLGANGRALIEKDFSWPAKLASLAALFAKAQSTNRRRAAPSKQVQA